jgi:hypothetical protein
MLRSDDYGKVKVGDKSQQEGLRLNLGAWKSPVLTRLDYTDILITNTE